MKYGMYLHVFLFFLLGGNGLTSQEKSTAKKKLTVAVLDLKSTGGLSVTEAATLTKRFRGVLVQTDSFNVVEREKMSEILKEQDFILTDMCSSDECAVQVGQLLGVEQMIAGDIGKVGSVYTIDLRLIDVSTGKILQTQTKNYSGKSEGLLVVMKVIAKLFAGMKVDDNELKEIDIISQKKSSPYWYVAGTIVAGGAAAFLLTQKKDSGAKRSIIDDPILPPRP